MEFTSISQGIFFRHPRKVKSKSSSEDFYNAQCLSAYGPPTSTIDLRQQFCYEHCQESLKILQDCQAEWFEGLTDEVSDYVKESSDSIKIYQGAVTPVGFVITGSPAKEHDEIMSLVHMKIKEHTRFVAQLQARSCNTIRSAFQSLVRALMDLEGCEANLSDEDPDDLEDATISGRSAMSSRSGMSKHINANDLKVWYKSQLSSMPIVVILSDIDLFAASLIQEIMITLCCLKLPIIFIGGITSCCENFESFIPRKCSTTFVYRTFEAVSPEDKVEQLMEKIVFYSKSLFRLSGPVVKYLMDVFLLQDYSVHRLQQLIQLCLVEHYRLPESILCSSFDSVMEKVVSDEDPAVNEGDLLLSLAGGVSSKGSSLKARIRKGLHDGKLSFSPMKGNVTKMSNRGEVRAQVQKFASLSYGWLGTLRFIHCVALHHPQAPVEFKSLSKFYDLCWSGKLMQENLVDYDSKSLFDQLLTIIAMMSKLELIRCLRHGLKVLQKFCSENEATGELSSLDKFMEQMQQHLSDLERPEDLSVVPVSVTPKVASRKSSKPAFSSQTEFLESMKEKAMGSQGKYQQLKNEVIKTITKHCTYYMKSPPLPDHALSKAFIFDDIEFLQSMITPNSCKLVHAGILEPEKFFEVTAASSNLKTRSDTSIVYELILEQQMRNVNLNLIYESFSVLVEAQSDNKVNPKSKKKDLAKEKDMLLLRFRQAIAELQHMGLVRKSKTKVHADEVIRLNFGF